MVGATPVSIHLLKAIRRFLLPAIALLLIRTAAAQEMPPRPMGVSFTRNLNFGAFSSGVAGGGVQVFATGSRISMGDVILLDYGYLYYPAQFELEGNPGTVIHFLAGPASDLTGNNGGLMTMTLQETEPSTPFILPSATNGLLEVSVGGLLTVGGPLSNPPGEYSGQFYVMFIQE